MQQLSGGAALLAGLCKLYHFVVATSRPPKRERLIYFYRRLRGIHAILATS